jgi:hypothetical protein
MMKLLGGLGKADPASLQNPPDNFLFQAVSSTREAGNVTTARETAT